jgi:hypothetical protein
VSLKESFLLYGRSFYSPVLPFPLPTHVQSVIVCSLYPNLSTLRSDFAEYVLINDENVVNAFFKT